MRVLLDNVDPTSTSGPNSFGNQLSMGLQDAGHIVDNLVSFARARTPIVARPDVHLAFIERNVDVAGVNLVQRLDGIYYNSDPQYGDWWTQNARINQTYEAAAGVVFQSPFSRHLVESFFEKKSGDDVVVIGNGVDVAAVAAVDPIDVDVPGSVWMSASTWRPHKRLGENVRYFIEHAGAHDIMWVAGADTGPTFGDPRVTYLGVLDRAELLTRYRRADVLVHLAYHDNCPNVVVDARAAGCDVVCASCAGTQYIAGPDATVIEEDEWVPGPIELYRPPKLDFSRKRRCGIDSDIDIASVVDRYTQFLSRYISRSL